MVDTAISLLGRTFSRVKKQRDARKGAFRVAVGSFLQRFVAPHILTVAALGAITYGVFQASIIAGWIVAGFSALIVDWKVQDS